MPPTTFRRLIVGSLQLYAAMAAILALSAWSLSFWQGWAFLLNFAICTVALTIYLANRDPALLERRLHAGPVAEREPRQKVIQTITSLAFAGLLIIPGLDHRFGWSHVGIGTVLAGHVLMVFGFLGWLMVFRENSFASGIIEVAPDQHVVDTGPYAVVRHPMYAAGLLLFLGMPLALGSPWALLALVPLLPALIARLLDEERYLDANLPGYRGYLARVRWRLVPAVW